MNMPIIRLSLEGMQMSILHAFAQYQVENDAMVKEAVEAFLKPENVQRIVAQCVEREIKSALEKEISTFFLYGAGRDFLAKAVKEKLLSSMHDAE